jgi:Tol biopolymer transport system component
MRRLIMVILPHFPRALLALLLATVASGLLAPVATNPAEAAFPGGNGPITFQSTRTSGPGVNNPEGDSEIFAMKPDGKVIEQITFNSTPDFGPAWPAEGDGVRIAYTGTHDGNSEIYMRDQGGSFIVTLRLTNNAANDTDAAFSPDGEQIAFLSDRGGNQDIYVMDAKDSDNDGNGDNLTRLTDNAAFDGDPAWSPDGNLIAFTSHRDGGTSQIYVMNAGGADEVNVSNTQADDFQPNWSPDGTKIAFTSTREGFDTIFMMNPDGSGATRLTKRAPLDFSPVWSPDGTKIAFTSDRGGGDSEIFVMKAKRESKKNRPRNLTKNGVMDGAADWRPLS